MAAQGGSAVIEFLGVLGGLLLPVIVACLAFVQLTAASYAASSAAREAARVTARATTLAQGQAAATAAAHLAFADQGLDPGHLELGYVAQPCPAPREAQACLAPGSVVTASVRTSALGISVMARASAPVSRLA